MLTLLRSLLALQKPPLWETSATLHLCSWSPSSRGDAVAGADEMGFGSLYQGPSCVGVCTSCQRSAVPQRRAQDLLRSFATLWLVIFSETLQGC